MNFSPYQFIFFHFWIFTFWVSVAPLLAQNDVNIKSCSPLSEHTLNQLLQEITSSTQDQGLQIGGIIQGCFTQKDQLDYVLWLNEQAPERKIVKLSCQNGKWQIVCMGTLPKGTFLSKENFKDVTGDNILELLYHFSYSDEYCVDGCGILSFQTNQIEALYLQKEQHQCQNIDWKNYQQKAELPFITYRLYQQGKGKEKGVLQQRFVKYYHGGLEQKEIIEHAQLDSSSTFLVYDKRAKQFISLLNSSCNQDAFSDQMVDPRHPAVRMASQQLNRHPAATFWIEGVHRASFSNKAQIDYLFYSNTFEDNNSNILKRKAVKITCDGDNWVVTGIIYIGADFSAKNIQDVNGDGIHEIIDEQVQAEENGCTKTYRILSFAQRVGQLLYSHKNTYAFCGQYSIAPNERQDGNPIGVEYQVHFQDLNNDGLKELLQESANGQVVFVYDTNQKQYIVKH